MHQLAEAAPALLGESRSLWRRIRADVALLGAGNVAIVLAQLGFRSLLVGSLAPAAYGRLSLVLGIYNVVWILGASGLPNAAARHIARIAPAEDSAIVRAAMRAAFWPALIAAALVAALAGAILHSPWAALLATLGLPSLVYTLLAMGILRGRGRVGAAACIMPIAALAELTPLALLRLGGVAITPLSAFAVFCLGNVIGLSAGMLLLVRTAAARSAAARSSEPAPSSRSLLGFSMWLALATLSLALLPLALRAAAAFDSYTAVALVDVALVLFALPQRLGAVIVLAVTPHVARAIEREDLRVTISAREHAVAIVPFALAAGVVVFTPLLGWIFSLLGRPLYASSADYLALALLAGPARVLYGVIEGVLIAHGQGRAMAMTALAVCALAAALICAATPLLGTTAAFVVFVLAFWAIYLLGLRRVARLSASA